MHETLGVDGRQRVDDLLVAGRPERRDREHLRLPAGEETGAVRPRQHADLDRDRPDARRVAAVRPQLLLGHRAPELLLEDRFERRGDLLRKDEAALLDELRDRLGLELVEAALALRLVRITQLGADALFEERDDRAELRRVELERSDRERGLADGAPELLLCVAELFDAFLRERERLDEEVLGHLTGTGLDHHDRVAGAGDDEVEIAFVHLLDRRVQRELAADGADADTPDRPFEGCVRDGQRRGGRVHDQYVVVVLLVGGPG